jgi:hypothetical protein
MQLVITTQVTWNHESGRRTVHVIKPETTKVKAIADAGRKLIEAHADYNVVERERTAAQGDPKRLAHQAKLAAQDAGRKGEKADVKELRAKVRDAEERLAEIELEYEVAGSRLNTEGRAYLAAIEHHAPALAAEAQSAAEAGILSLATASSMARRADAQMSGALAVLAALGAVQDDSADFVPKAPRARTRGFGEGGVPGPYVTTAVTSITTAIGFATEILDDMRKAEKERTLLAKVEAESDALVAVPGALAGDSDDEDEQ